MKEKLKKIIQFIANPRLVLCMAVAWLITNGWSYIFIALGAIFHIGWMSAAGWAYVAFLWALPTPEKLVTFPIAIFLLRWWFPNDTKTLAVLRDFFHKAKAAWKRHKEKWKNRKNKNTDDPQQPA